MMFNVGIQDLRWAPLETLDVSGNKLVGFVPPMLCATGDINGNGENGEFHCDIIACSAGTWSPIGRATQKRSRAIEDDNRYECLPCPGGTEHLGSKLCPKANVIGSIKKPVYVDDTFIVGAVLAAMCLCCSSGLIGAKVQRLLYGKSSDKTSKNLAIYGDTETGPVENDDGQGSTRIVACINGSGDVGGEEELYFLNNLQDDNGEEGKEIS